MPYITINQPERICQISFEDIIFGNVDFSKVIYNNKSNTVTRWVKEIDRKYLDTFNIHGLISELQQFNERYRALHERDRQSLYHTYHIPKRSGGLRRIDEPLPPLMEALRNLKFIFEQTFQAKYHTAAYAYIPGRSTVHAVRKHQQNESQWFLKLDLKDFFGSTSMEFVMKQLSMIFPFSEVVKYDDGRQELQNALDLCFLNGGLPQGTPISPMLTNLVMIPIDHYLATTLRKNETQHLIYTRYADDMLVSGRASFDWEKIQSYINDVFFKFSSPYKINEKKTHYGSRSGSNWNLGIMLNKDNQMTVGYRNKKLLRAMIDHYLKDRVNGVSWELGDMQALNGHINYLKMVEGESAQEYIGKVNQKYKVNLMRCLKHDIGNLQRQS